MNSVLKLRSAQLDDIVDTYKWISESEVLSARFTQNKISFDEHAHWFKTRLKDSRSALFIICRENEKIGMLRGIQQDANSFEVSIILSKPYQGLGYGPTSIRLGIKEIHQQFSVGHFTAQVRKDNPGSQKAFERAGFKNSKEILVNKVPGFLMEYQIS